MPYHTTTHALVPSETRTADGAGSAIKVSEYIEGLALLDITAVSGTGPTLDVDIETSPDGQSWFVHSSFSQKAAAEKDVLKLTNVGTWIRANWRIAGTIPSFTFALYLVGKTL